MKILIINDKHAQKGLVTFAKASDWKMTWLSRFIKFKLSFGWLNFDLSCLSYLKFNLRKKKKKNTKCRPL